MQEATLSYVIKDGKILLAKIKKGFSEGKWNGPGGKMEKDETPQDCAKRESFEEIKIIPEAPQKIGEIVSHHADGSSWKVYIFVADEYDGIEKETDEAVPKWFRLDKIPYNEMPKDQSIWMPLMLAGKKFRGAFIFDGEMNVVSHEIIDLEDVISSTENN